MMSSNGQVAGAGRGRREAALSGCSDVARRCKNFSDQVSVWRQPFVRQWVRRIDTGLTRKSEPLIEGGVAQDTNASNAVLCEPSQAVTDHRTADALVPPCGGNGKRPQKGRFLTAAGNTTPRQNYVAHNRRTDDSDK